MLMDMAFDREPSPAKRRVHWNDWMLDVHARLHAAMVRDRQSAELVDRRAKLRRLGYDMAAEARVLCFDELAVYDVADALILREIFGAMLHAGVTVFATSNRRPHELYENGINRDLFLPFVRLLERRCDVVDLFADATDDFRHLEAMSSLEASTNWHVGRRDAFDAALREAAGPRGLNPTRVDCEHFGRAFSVQASSSSADAETESENDDDDDDDDSQRGHPVAFSSFSELCGRPTGADDYLALAKRFDTVFVSDVPQFAAARSDEARRFVTLVDVLYERRCGLVAHASCPIDDLLSAEQAAPDVMRIDRDSLGGGDGAMTVVDAGGSSGRLTTLIGGATEWSATGRIGVSLGELAGVKDLQFAWARTHSRLVQLTSKLWAQGARASRRLKTRPAHLSRGAPQDAAATAAP